MFIQIKIVLIAFAFYFAKVVKFGRPKMILNVKNILITFSDKFFAFPFDNIYLPMRRSEKHFNIFNIDWTKKRSTFSIECQLWSHTSQWWFTLCLVIEWTLIWIRPRSSMSAWLSDRQFSLVSFESCDPCYGKTDRLARLLPQMTSSEPWTSGVRSNRSTNWTTTTAWFRMPPCD